MCHSCYKATCTYEERHAFRAAGEAALSSTAADAADYDDDDDDNDNDIVLL